MKDYVAPKDQPDAAPLSHDCTTCHEQRGLLQMPEQVPCPACGLNFDRTNRRKDAKFCSPRCQKNSARGARTVAESPELRRRASDHNSRAKWLAHDLYSLAPFERLGAMAALIAEARKNCAQLRNILTDPKLLGAGREDRGLFHRKAPGTYKTIAQAADAYCRMFWGHGVKAVIYKLCPEPETGETDATETPDIHLRTHKGGEPQGTVGINFGASAKRKPPAKPEGWDYRVWVAQTSHKVRQRIEEFAAKHRTQGASPEPMRLISTSAPIRGEPSS